MSLHLSSHGDGVGAFNQGFMYALKPTINRQAAYDQLEEVLTAAAAEVEKDAEGASLFRDTLRPSRLRSWESYFYDKPYLGGEVSALAGYLGVSLCTVNDARADWGTPRDVPDRVDFDFARRQSELVSQLVWRTAAAEKLSTGKEMKNGFSVITGRAKFLRHGELFADQPAPGTVLLAFQGPGVFHAWVDQTGGFVLKGMADKIHVLDKVIIEGYRFDPKNGRVIWAIDKEQTGKDAYRVKMQRRSMETDLVMFACLETTLFDLLEPRSFRHMTKIDLLDGRREASPLRYWYSRIDTRESIITSVYLEPGTPLKLTLSDTALNKKMVLTNAAEGRSSGVGYLIDEWPKLNNTTYLVARDMWALLGPRIKGLEDRGIYNEKIRELSLEGRAALARAEEGLAGLQYDLFTEESARSWALAARVYDHVEKTQKDVLFGVLFYIALFVPFAFCLERLLFSYTDIHKRLIAFGAILLLLIGIIYKVHPAFQLAYSPMVVILAFFIMGLSLIVTLIIFLRFEEEMVLLQKRASHQVVSEVSRWHAFVAAFFLGVSNLRRRRLRTALTCTTLIILTFTIMSFTSVQTLRHRSRIMFQDAAPYQGVLLKKVNWKGIPPEALDIIVNTFKDKGVVAPRVWLEPDNKTQPLRAPVRRGDKVFEAQGLIGLSSGEGQATGLDKFLVGGRWFRPGERTAVLLPDRMARELGIDPARPEGEVSIWGEPFQVVGVFSGRELGDWRDLDGEPPTPVTFPDEEVWELSEAEMDAMESGDDVRAFQGRYQHVSGELTVILPYQTVLAAGGDFKGAMVRPLSGDTAELNPEDLVDRFKLALFIGEKDGTFLYHASDTLSYSGVPNILIPLLISIFIVLNTMIGSVYERKREIGIYTSVGLAPSHVSFLFIAESMAFAVLSVVLGYLVAQGTAAFLSGTSLWSGITVNYSSLSGVAAMILIFLVVLISVIYPSRVAGQIAIPDVNRSWSLPEAQGNVLSVTLPILMKHHEFMGVGGYLYHYFLSHRDVSHGLFSTDEIDFTLLCDHRPRPEDKDSICPGVECECENCLHFSTKAWLAPFDFGIMQRVTIDFCPSEDNEGFLEMQVQLVREAGEANAWRRINKAFIHKLRKQLLVWRSLDNEAQAAFHQALIDAEAEKEAERACD